MKIDIFWSLLTFCVGLLAGHWLHLARDQRKEFNDVADPIRSALLSARGTGHPAFLKVSPVEWEIVRAHQKPWRRAAFDRALAQVNASYQCYDQTDTGDIRWREEPVNAATKALLAFINRK